MPLLSLKFKYDMEAGCDEAGRGCLAGPVVAASVILPPDFINTELNDSKKLNHRQREKLRLIIEKEALSWSYAIVNNIEVDSLNVLNASIEAMHRAVNSLSLKPKFLLIDGNRFKDHATIPHQCFVKGDGRFLTIAAASVIAKTYRDDLMLKLDLECPEYHWKSNKGYPTLEHRKALMRYGPTKYHRRSFNLLNPQLELFC